MNGNVLTTGDVSRACRVSQQTAIRWIDAGRLPGWRVPGSTHRRVTRESLARFMAANGLPAQWLPEGADRRRGEGARA